MSVSLQYEAVNKLLLNVMHNTLHSIPHTITTAELVICEVWYKDDHFHKLQGQQCFYYLNIFSSC